MHFDAVAEADVESGQPVSCRRGVGRCSDLIPSPTATVVKLIAE